MDEKLFHYRAVVTEVYDGDTVTVEVDLGFRIQQTIRVRLAGIDTPELRGDEREEGLKVRDYVRERVLGKTVILVTTKDKTGKYGRYLGRIFIDGVDLNQELLDRGMAKPYKN